jgi:hypothetical protein
VTQKREQRQEKERRKLQAALKLRLVKPPVIIELRTAQLSLPGLRWNYRENTVFVYPE